MSESTQVDDAPSGDDDTNHGEPPEVDQRAELDAANDRADKYARELLTARVAATGRLADPSDLPFSADLVDDTDALTTAIDALLAAKPHLASRKPAWGDVGAGQSTHSSGAPTFVDFFRS